MPISIKTALDIQQALIKAAGYLSIGRPITPSTKIKRLGIDEIDLVELAVSVECELDVDIEESIFNRAMKQKTIALAAIDLARALSPDVKSQVRSILEKVFIVHPENWNSANIRTLLLRNLMDAPVFCSQFTEGAVEAFSLDVHAADLLESHLSTIVFWTFQNLVQTVEQVLGIAPIEDQGRDLMEVFKLPRVLDTLDPASRRLLADNWLTEHAELAADSITVKKTWLLKHKKLKDSPVVVKGLLPQILFKLATDLSEFTIQEVPVLEI